MRRLLLVMILGGFCLMPGVRAADTGTLVDIEEDCLFSQFQKLFRGASPVVSALCGITEGTEPFEVKSQSPGYPATRASSSSMMVFASSYDGKPTMRRPLMKNVGVELTPRVRPSWKAASTSPE